MKKLILFFGLVLSGFVSNSQIVGEYDMTADFDKFFLLSDERGFAVGNGCDSEAYMKAHYYGDMDMDFQDLQLMHAHVIVHGNITNMGPVVYSCSTSILEILGGTLSNPDIDDTITTKVFPIPANTTLNVVGYNIKTMTITDMNGKIVSDYKTYGAQHILNVSDLATGVYFLRINNLITRKIIIKR